MHQPIFLDRPTIEFDGEKKYAGLLTPLGDNADRWPQEILSEGYRQLPYLSEFDVDIGLDKINEEAGFAFGSLVVRPKSQMTVEERAETPLLVVHIPVVVREGNLAPLDVFQTGGVFKRLTEGKLRTALLDPRTFDAIREQPKEPGIYNDLRPPVEATVNYGGVKLGSLNKLPLLPMLHGRVKEAHVKRVQDAVSDPTLRSKIASNRGVSAAFASAMGLEPTSLQKSAEAAWSSIPPNVVQLRRLDNGNYMAKWANTDVYSPQTAEIPPQVAQEVVGDLDLSARLESDGSVTASPDAAIKDTPDTGDVRAVDQFGLWLVQEQTGADLTGWCFPQLMTFDMKPMPLVLFTNGSQYALQSQIAGKLIGKSADIPKGTPKGYGCFYYLDHGTAKAFVPMTVQNSFRDPSGSLTYIGSNDMGEEATLHVLDALKKVVQIGDGEYGIPADLCWLPLKAKTELVTEPLMFSKVAGRVWIHSGELIGDGQHFTFRGPPFAKLASEQKQFLTRMDAEFLGVAAGVHENFIKVALDRASSGQVVTLEGLKILGTAKEKLAAVKTKLAREIAALNPPLRNYNLVKEAAVLEDAMTADKILGLGFLNAENVATFVEFLPSFEATASHLAELLVASRLGMKDIPEIALERCMAALDDVILSLHRLRQKEVTFDEQEN